MYAFLIFALTTTTVPKPPSDVQKFLKTVGATLEEACHAAKRFKTYDVSRIAPCEIGGDVKEIRGDQCTGSKGHYTLYDGICQCNDDGRHSERIVLERGETHLENLAFPCLKQCYPAFIKDLLEHKSKTIRMTYVEVRDPASLKIHDWFMDHCHKILEAAR